MDEDLANDDERNGAGSNVDEEDDSNEKLTVGGKVAPPCFCLLDGIHEDPETGEKSRVTIPITRLPATLGRSHETDDELFFGLGKKKALSRKQCQISYRDSHGGKVEWNSTTKELVYNKPTKAGEEAKKIKSNGELPKRGFFVVECLGKNRILVDKDRVEQGEATPLESGSAIRISSYMLYFLLPQDASAKTHLIPIEGTKKRKTPETVHSNASEASASKKSKSATGLNYQSELDSLPVDNLLELMNKAIKSNQWERRHQLIGATIALHAIRDAARAKEIQEVALDGGISRSEIMTWMENSPKYGRWVEQMLTKMEARSYQAAVTKSLLKGGFTRTGSSGRYIKWLLPSDIPVIVTKKPKSEAPDQAKSQDDGSAADEGQEDGDEEENDDDNDDDGDDDDDGEGGEQGDSESNIEDDEGDDKEEGSGVEDQEEAQDEQDSEGGENASGQEEQGDSGSELGGTGGALPTDRLSDDDSDEG